MTYYVYLHARPRTEDVFGVFYVGKGKGKRAYDFKERNPFHSSVIKKHGESNILVSKIPCSSEGIAFDLEKGIIKCLRRMGVSLSNMTDGGEGMSGYKYSEESRKKMSEAWVGRIVSEETKAKLSNVHSLRYTSDEERKKTGAASLGKVRINKGGVEKSVRPEELERFLSEGWIKGRKMFKRGKPSEATRQKISAANKGQVPWNKGVVFNR